MPRGIISTTYYKDPEDPKWANDTAMKGYKDGIKAFSSRSNPNDPFQAMQVQRFDGKHWKLVGDVVQKPH